MRKAYRNPVWQRVCCSMAFVRYFQAACGAQEKKSTRYNGMMGALSSHRMAIATSELVAAYVRDSGIGWRINLVEFFVDILSSTIKNWDHQNAGWLLDSSVPLPVAKA
ncbi:hypothetical protein KM043_005537 [Ampulex compressa]|nr:hypothetical protein KM043_005537 [Ampulex compressa]